PKECNGVKIPVDTSKPNPNEVEFDNLYLDMNGIIHPCTHPEDKPAPKNEDEMMVAIFEYIDRLFNIVRPRRLLYMAIDGVVSMEMFVISGFLPPEEVKERFDSNCITPGTEFMDNLAKCLRYYVADRLNNDPGWKNLTVILSDASAPGEGEHKIMDYIRRQRAQPNHDPNTHHCLCGADADLIMLGLATHEPNFTIIREEFKPNKPKPCGLCNQFGHEVKDCQGLPKEKQGEHDQFADCPPGMEQEFIFIRLCVLREYLERELTMASLPFTFDVERSIDDWVFMCFFVGNDFLPHLPSLEIREGAIDRLVNIYKNVVHKTGENFKRRQKEKRRRIKREQHSMAGGQFTPQPLGRGNRSSHQPINNPRHTAFEMRMQDRQNTSASASPNTSFTSDGTPSPAGGIKRKAEDSDSEPEPEDNVRLWEAGWKQRYYKNKFDVDVSDKKFRRKVVQSYVEGLCWVLRYYYQFKPLEQLMGVFPAASGNFLPLTWRKLMTDPESSIIDFYPEDFAIDLNGKKYAWQGVALLPFVDERRLRAALAEREEIVLVVMFFLLGNIIQFMISSLNNTSLVKNRTVHSPVPMLRDLTQNSAISINFKDPQFQEDFIFKAVVLSGAKKPPPVLKPGDWEKSNNDNRPWRPQLGFNRDRRQVHLDQSAFRTLGHAMSRDRGQSGSGVYSNIAPPGTYNQGNAYRPLLSRPQQQIPKLLSNLRPQDSWQGPTPLFQQPQQRFDRNSGATPLLAWNRTSHSQGPPYQQNQYQGPSGSVNYSQRPSERRERGRQGYGRPYPLPPSSGRYNWN
ncbi:hypothetical protein JD844_017017, partial [Phrynosoma platyrhinos]